MAERWWYWALICLVLTSGCSSIIPSREIGPKNVYVLEATAVGKPRFSPQGPSIQVSRIRTAPGYGGTGMVYVEQEHRLDHFLHHRWADTPARMLEPLVIGTLEASGMFSAVVSPDARARTNLRLDTEFLRLVRRFEGGGSRVDLAIRASVVDTDRASLAPSRVIEITEPVVDPTPYGGVEAANRAVARLLEELRVFLEAQVSSGPR
jgi:cholesterol transport system auxiliary component